MANVLSFHSLHGYIAAENSQIHPYQNSNKKTNAIMDVANGSMTMHVKYLHRGNDPAHSRTGLSSSFSYDGQNFYSIPSVWQFFVVTSCVWILIVLYQTIFEIIKHIHKSTYFIVFKVYNIHMRQCMCSAYNFIRQCYSTCFSRKSSLNRCNPKECGEGYEEGAWNLSEVSQQTQSHESDERIQTSDPESIDTTPVTETTTVSEEHSVSLPALIQKHGILLLPLSSWFQEEKSHLAIIQKGYSNECLIHRGNSWQWMHSRAHPNPSKYNLIREPNQTTATQAIIQTGGQNSTLSNPGSPAPFPNDLHLISSIPDVPVIMLDPWKIAYAVYGWGVSCFLVSFCISGLSSICLLLTCLLWHAVPSFAYHDKERNRSENIFFTTYNSFFPLHKFATLVSWISLLFIIVILYDPFSHVFTLDYSHAIQNKSNVDNEGFICPWYYPCMFFNYSYSIHSPNYGKGSYLWYYLLVYLLIGVFIFFKGTQEAIRLQLNASKILSLYSPSLSIIGSVIVSLFAIFLELSNSILDAHRDQHATQELSHKTSEKQHPQSEFWNSDSFSDHHFYFLLLIVCPFCLYFSINIIVETLMISSSLKFKTLSSCIVFSYLFIYSIHIKPKHINQLNSFFSVPRGNWDVAALCMASFAFGLHLLVESISIRKYHKYSADLH